MPDDPTAVITITPPPEVVVTVSPSDPPTLELTVTQPPEIVEVITRGLQGPPGPLRPLNQITAPTGPVSLAGYPITDLGAPAAPTDAVNLDYVDTRFIELLEDIKPGPITQTKSTITENFSLEPDYNGISTGPVTISDGVTVTIPPNSTWIVI